MLICDIDEGLGALYLVASLIDNNYALRHAA